MFFNTAPELIEDLRSGQMVITFGYQRM